MNPLRPVTVAVLIGLVMLPAAGCSTTRQAYYNAWEKFGGYAKRERLVDNVKEARQEQVEAKQQFANALEQFKSVVNFDGGNLEKVYNKLDDEYQGAEKQAGQVRDKITGVKRVAAALFEEWKGEVAEIKDDPTLQSRSGELLDQTRSNYDQMVQRMDAAAASMDPVLSKFKNRVLHIKHNLNASAIASLRGTEVELGDDIDQLIRQMEASIAEADQFIAEIEAGAKSEGRRQKAEGRRQKAEGRRQKAEGRRQKARNLCTPPSSFCLHPSAFSSRPRHELRRHVHGLAPTYGGTEP